MAERELSTAERVMSVPDEGTGFQKRSNGANGENDEELNGIFFPFPSFTPLLRF